MDQEDFKCYKFINFITEDLDENGEQVMYKLVDGKLSGYVYINKSFTFENLIATGAFPW